MGPSLMEDAQQEAARLVRRWTPGELADAILSRPRAPSSWGPRIAAAASSLHKTLGVETPATLELMKRLASGDAIIVRLAHQPNLFPYVQLMAQTAYLHLLASALRDRGSNVVPVVFLVDHDVAENKRVRTASVFDKHIKGQIRGFEIKIGEYLRKVPIYICQSPASDNVEAITRSLFAYAISRGVMPEFLLENTGVSRSWKTLGDFNAFSWANCAVRLWDLPLLFVRLSDLLMQSEPPRLELAGRLAAVSGKEVGDFHWRICLSCRRRVGSNETCCGSIAPAQPSLPRVELDNITDIAIYGVSGGTAHGKSAEHIIPAYARALSLGLPVAPEAVWLLEPPHPDLTPSDHCSTRAKELVSTGRNALVQHLMDASSARGLRDRLFAGIGGAAP